MTFLKRGLVFFAAAAILPVGWTAHAASARLPKIEAAPGTIVRWTVPGTKRCGMNGRGWAALQETCYYPVDLLQKPTLFEISRQGVGNPELAQISVGPYPYGTEDITLPDIPQAHPSPADLQRNSRDQVRLGKVWARPEGPARFTLPLRSPISPAAEGKAFGSRWVFNGKPDSVEQHTGADYSLKAGTPITAVADGTVVLAEDLFFPGNAVFIDHGDGLVSMYFHLAEFKVKDAQEVKRGDTIGLVGTTGRTSGPHLHLGLRWHGARVNPQLLLGDPAKIPAVSP